MIFLKRDLTGTPSSFSSSIARTATATFSITLLSTVAFHQPAQAGCTSTGSTVTCSGTTTATDAPIAEVTSGGSVVIEGSASVSGKVGYGVVGVGNETSLTNNGTLSSSGASLDAMEVLGDRNTITNNGSISTAGSSASALHALGNSNTLLNTGRIDTTTGSAALGLFAEGNENRLTNSGTVVTGGNGSEGLSVYGNGNTLTNAGDIATSGAVANGIRAYGNNNAILNTGIVTTSGVEGRGIKVDAGTGNSIVNRGTIDTSGERAYGVWVASKAGETTTIVNESAGIIRAWNDKAIQSGAGNESIQNFGVLSTSSGGVAIELGAGNDALLIGSTSRITGVVDAGADMDTFTLGGAIDASFDAALIGDGAQYRNFETYEKIGTSTWTVTGTNNDTMPWHVREGGLMVTGTMGGSSMIVYDGAILSGSGTVGGIDARSGSILSPGANGIGSMAVTGNVLIANGTTYRIDLNASQESDRIVAEGTASVQGGTVQVNALPGDYTPGSRWTILTAKGGVTGQFSEVTTNLAFFRPVLSKDGKNIYLGLMRIERPLPVDRPTPRPFDPVTEDELPFALDQTSGAPIVSAMGTILVHDDLFRSAVLCRLRCSEGLPGIVASEFVTAGYAADLPGRPVNATRVPVSIPQATRDWTMWAKAIGSWGSTDATPTSYALDRSTAGLVFGVDSGFGTPYRLGLAAGYFSTDLDFATLASGGNVESLHIGAYGSAAFGAFNLRGGVAYAHHDVDMVRTIRFTGFSGTNRSDSSVDSVQAFGELGYEIMLSDRVMLEPFAGLAHVHVTGRNVWEEGSDLAVSGEVHSFDTTYSTLGARLVATMPTDAGTITFKGLLGWRHAFGDIVPKATFSYVGDGRPFLVTGAPIDKDSLIVEAGLNWEVAKDVTLNVSYSGAMGARDQEHTVRGGFNIRF
ncbi:autotransporter domain-containing protein [Microvirga sp. ACRRW]|uniref:autotransporter family protein n=1 Tax=Microvirga sp. ACRRW TaxID=2918205 RepID=UPI001EF57BB3|nr:autotransporter outer membrane beta-barrel domain-containing protein [Microvirga sp. ACRRW]MCG7392283.1 autotransporter domain-containing protein [Microvirga sp. ACRRW]